MTHVLNSQVVDVNAPVDQRLVEGSHRVRHPEEIRTSGLTTALHPTVPSVSPFGSSSTVAAKGFLGMKACDIKFAPRVWAIKMNGARRMLQPTVTPYSEPHGPTIRGRSRLGLSIDSSMPIKSPAKTSSRLELAFLLQYRANSRYSSWYTRR
ncbi:hypothetical protein C8R45DRAFT_929477 [Mycena sanguinolenta]|nr:hypothetical protein C8R45DRAFT_929477 [Mycena sanguinolenta]